jgi:archaellum component FlaC
MSQNQNDDYWGGSPRGSYEKTGHKFDWDIHQAEHQHHDGVRHSHDPFKHDHAMPRVRDLETEVEGLRIAFNEELECCKQRGVEIERLKEWDEVHWKTRRSLLAEVERLQHELHEARLGRMKDDEDELERLRALWMASLDDIRELNEAAQPCTRFHGTDVLDEVSSLKAEVERLRAGRQRDDEYIQELNDELERLRAALERIAHVGPGAVEAYHDPLRGMPATGDAMQRVAREALRPTSEDEGLRPQDEA